MVVTSDLRTGSAFKYGNDALIVQRMLGQKGGRAGIVTKLRVKNIVTGQTMDLGLDAGEKFDEVDLDHRDMKLSYLDGDTFVFMDQETFEQVELSKEDLGDNAGYLTPEDDIEVQITFYEEKPVGITLPIAVQRTITYWRARHQGRHLRQEHQARHPRHRHRSRRAPLLRHRHQDQHRHPRRLLHRAREVKLSATAIVGGAR